MDLKQLKYFVTIVEEKNISSAAKKLFMSQPPLSSQMNLLEEELGTILFIRGKKEISLTEAGKILYERSKSLLKLADITKEELIDNNLARTGVIRIGVVSSVEDFFISNWLKNFNLDLNFEFYEENTYKLLEKLKNNEIELAIIRTPFNTNFKVIPLIEESLVAFGSNFVDNEYTTLKELSNMNLCIYRRWYDLLKEEYSKKHLNFSAKYVNDDARTSLSLAKNNLATAIVPESIVKSIDIDKKRIRKIKDLNIKSTISLVYNEKSYITVAAQSFINFLSNK